MPPILSANGIAKIEKPHPPLVGQTDYSASFKLRPLVEPVSGCSNVLILLQYLHFFGGNGFLSCFRAVQRYFIRKKISTSPLVGVQLFKASF